MRPLISQEYYYKSYPNHLFKGALDGSFEGSKIRIGYAKNLNT